MESYRNICIYDAVSYILVVGNTKSADFYKVLKICKMPSTLDLQEVKRSFTRSELDSYLKTLFPDPSRCLILHADVLLGVVKFMQGFYLYLVTKKTKSATLRGKSIYKIESAKLLKLFTEKKSKDEKRYYDIFNSLDITLGFYFSYTFDLTHTLQENIVNDLQKLQPSQSRARARTFNSYKESKITVNLENHELYDWKTIHLWNHDMISSLYSILTDKNWLVPMIHGFVGYRCMSILGRKYDLVLISRRSRFFAGTRYLKRGLSEDGKVANDVETEQIIIEKIPTGKMTAFVQHRGSVPLFWCQDPTSMLPSPPIIMNQNDFLHDGTIKHFSDLFSRYGAPIIIINLLRVTDKNKENNLSHEYQTTVESLNEQIPEEFKLQYNSFDIKNEIKKSKKEYEQKFYNIFKDRIGRTSVFTAIVKKEKIECSLQIGVIRTNCVDCIDRTNEGQLLISHLALEYQLKQLGISESLSMKSDIVQVLTKLFEEMGDAIALQYTGSIAHKATNSKEKGKQNKIIVAAQRHLANLTKDPKKQQSINLFLGIYKTNIYPIHLWDITDDFRLHNKVNSYSRIDSKWWKTEINRFYGKLNLRKKEIEEGFGKDYKKSKEINRVKIFNFEKNILIDKPSYLISSLDKSSVVNCEIYELLIQEDVKVVKKEEIKPKIEEKQKNHWKSQLEVSSDDVELFVSYTSLSEINTKDNFYLAMVPEEIHSEIKEINHDDYNDYLNFTIDTRNLLREFDDEDDENSEIKEMEPEIIDIVIIDEYFSQYQPPSYLKCIHYKEFRT